MRANKIVIAFWLFMASIWIEVSVTDSSVDSEKTIVFVTTICMNDIDVRTIGFINSNFFRCSLKQWSCWIKTCDTEISLYQLKNTFNRLTGS